MLNSHGVSCGMLRYVQIFCHNWPQSTLFRKKYIYNLKASHQINLRLSEYLNHTCGTTI